MKKLYILTAIFYLSCMSLETLHAQCVNSVVTNPNNASNSQLPDVATPDQSTYIEGNRYLNGFNWWQPSEYYLNDMFYNFGQPYPDMENIQSAESANIYAYLNKFLGGGAAAKVMLPENGWELLLVNLGWYPDYMTENDDQTLSTAPYIVLYNRYTAIARVFVQYGYNEPPSGSIDGVKINMTYLTSGTGIATNLSGIFRLGEGHDKALAKKTAITSLTAVAPAAGSNRFWMSGDFQLAYDPCVCYKPTNISLEFEFFTESAFKLNGRGVAFDEPIFNGTGIRDLDFLSGVNNSSGVGEDNGYFIYKYIDTLISDYEKRLDDFKDNLALVNKQNKEVERNLAIF